MPRNIEREKVFLQIGFNASERTGSLQTIELIGMPGEKLANGECVISPKTQHFFDDLIVKPIFAESRRLRNCNFGYLKIWLYDPDTRDNQRGYEVPKIDNQDLKISSNITDSELVNIYVLDNGLKGEEYKQWEQTAEILFSPLFRKFVAPPSLPDAFNENPLFKFIDSVVNTVDKYGEMKRSLFFNNLIIQID